MQKKISSVPFKGTPEQEAKLMEVIAKSKDDPGAVMPVLQEAQEIYGYLPIEVQKMVADGLGVSLEEVYGVSTFYSQFALSPKGKYNISVCLGSLLCKGLGRYPQRAYRTARYRPRGVHRRRQVLAYRVPLYRRLRSCAGSHRQ